MTEHRDRWVRFHSLPESKRYASDEIERRTILHRHYTVLGELFSGADVLIMTSKFSFGPQPEPRTRFDQRTSRSPIADCSGCVALDSAERDALRERHSDWLSAHPSGM